MTIGTARHGDRVLVTGGCGFIGSHVVDALIERGTEVVVIDDLSTGRLENLNPNAVWCQGDIRDASFVRETFERYRPTHAIHQAAKINWGAETELPTEDVAISVLGTLNIITSCLALGVRRLVYASSVSVYGRPERLPVFEDDLQQPIYSYGISKRCAEQYIQYYAQNYGLRYTILRYANVYGPRQRVFGEVGVIAIFASRIAQGEDLVIYGDGEHVRDYVFIDDARDLTVQCLDGSDNQVMNVGQGVAVTTNELLRAFCKAVGSELRAVSRPERCGELGKLFLNVDRAASLFGWRPTVSLEEGIARTVKSSRSMPAVVESAKRFE